jgi:hypothetical protein
MNDLMLMGLDIETTMSDAPPRGRLLQIGVCMVADRLKPMLAGAKFGSDVGYPDYTLMERSAEADKVHGITLERIGRAPSVWDVDRELTLFLVGNGVGPQRAIAIGWNVGGFDMPFVRFYLPVAAQRFSYRTIDLNSVCMTLGEARGIPWKNLKDKSKAYAAEWIRATHPDLGPHDARYDAMEAVACWRWLVSEIGRD